MNRITNIDLYMQYHKDTGNVLDINNRSSKQAYNQYLEDKLLEKMNEEREVEELFNNTSVI